MGESPEVNINNKAMYVRRLGLELARNMTQSRSIGAQVNMSRCLIITCCIIFVQFVVTKPTQGTIFIPCTVSINYMIGSFEIPYHGLKVRQNCWHVQYAPQSSRRRVYLEHYMVLDILAPTDFFNSYSYQRDFREPHFTEGRCGTARWPLYRQSVALPSFLQF